MTTLKNLMVTSKLSTPNPRFLRTLGPPNIGSAKIEGAKIKVIVM